MKKFNHSRGFYIYGKNAVEETILAEPGKVAEVFFVQEEKGKSVKGVDEIVSAAKSHGVRMQTIDEKKENRLVGDVKTQGVIAYYTGFTYSHFSDLVEKIADHSKSCVLVLDGIEDVQNFGAIIRTAVAVGVDAVMVSDFHQAPVSGGTFKTSAGTIGKIPIIQFAGMGQAMEDLKKNDFWLYGVDMPDEESERTNPYPAGNIWQQKFDGRCAIIVGGEGKGISQKAKEKCDFIAPIPMENTVESLNVSVAAAVALYEWKRQQGISG